MDEVMEAKNLLLEELRCYCRLLSGTKPSTILSISQHMIALFNQEKLSKDTMRSVGLVNLMVDYLVLPKVIIVCQHSSTKY